MKSLRLPLALSVACLVVVPLFAGERTASPSAAAATTTTPEAPAIFPIPKLTGSIFERERLLGDFGGGRQTLAEHGLQFDFTLVQFYQGVLSGGETDRWAREVGTTAVRTLTGNILDRAATRRVDLQQQLQAGAAERRALAQERVRALGDKARERFESLPRLEQLLILRRISQIPTENWQNVRAEVRTALEAKIASGREALDQFFQDKVSRLNLGNFGNTGQDSQDYFGLWTFETRIDTGKMGLWPGGAVFMRVQGQYGDGVNSRAGTLLPVNTDSLLPEPGLDDVTIPQLYFMQFLSDHLAVVLGKLDTLGGDSNEFAHILGDDRFIGSAFGFNPVTASLAPYSPLGAAIAILPTKDLTIQLSAFDGDGVPTRSGFDTVFEGKTTYAAEAKLATHLLGKPGHQLIGGMLGNGHYTEFRQDLRAFVPGTGVDLKQSDDSWAIYYNFDQYFWTQPEDSTRGWGMFGRVGIADESTNAIAQFYSVGLGGKGSFATRPYDRWGVGYYYMKASDDLPTFLQLGDEQGGEAFYTVAVTPAFLLTADLQVTDSAKKHVDTSVIAGVRATLRF